MEQLVPHRTTNGSLVASYSVGGVGTAYHTALQEEGGDHLRPKPTEFDTLRIQTKGVSGRPNSGVSGISTPLGGPASARGAAELVVPITANSGVGAGRKSGGQTQRYAGGADHDFGIHTEARCVMAVLNDEFGYSQFLTYAKSEFNSENAILYRAVQRYRTYPTAVAARRLYKTFLGPNASLPLNVSFETVQLTKALLADILAMDGVFGGRSGNGSPLHAGSPHYVPTPPGGIGSVMAGGMVNTGGTPPKIVSTSGGGLVLAGSRPMSGVDSTTPPAPLTTNQPPAPGVVVSPLGEARSIGTAATVPPTAGPSHHIRIGGGGGTKTPPSSNRRIVHHPTGASVPPHDTTTPAGGGAQNTPPKPGAGGGVVSAAAAGAVGLGAEVASTGGGVAVIPVPMAPINAFDAVEREVVLVMAFDGFNRFKSSALGKSCEHLWKALADQQHHFVPQQHTTVAVSQAAAAAPLSAGTTGGVGSGRSTKAVARPSPPLPGAIPHSASPPIVSTVTGAGSGIPMPPSGMVLPPPASTAVELVSFAPVGSETTAGATGGGNSGGAGGVNGGAGGGGGGSGGVTLRDSVTSLPSTTAGSGGAATPITTSHAAVQSFLASAGGAGGGSGAGMAPSSMNAALTSTTHGGGASRADGLLLFPPEMSFEGSTTRSARSHSGTLDTPINAGLSAAVTSSGAATPSNAAAAAAGAAAASRKPILVNRTSHPPVAGTGGAGSSAPESGPASVQHSGDASHTASPKIVLVPLQSRPVLPPTSPMADPTNLT